MGNTVFYSLVKRIIPSKPELPARYYAIVQSQGDIDEKNIVESDSLQVHGYTYGCHGSVGGS